MKEIIQDIALGTGIDWKVLYAFIEAETGGVGFKNGKILIQFEPAYFKRGLKTTTTTTTLTAGWLNNKVDVQTKEWEAFNSAFKIDPTLAMESTSIGLGQIMGIHWKRLGYKSVGEMWDDAKVGENRQIYQIIKFIRTDRNLVNAIQNKDWNKIAELYNGKGYKLLARKLGREPYDQTMKRFYESLDK